MALFKILRGNSTNLADMPFKDGFCYFAADTGLFYVDFEKDGEQLRIPLNANDAITLSGATLTHDILTDSMVEIPSSALLTTVKESLEAQINTQTKVIELNKNLEQKFWRGTKEEYDAIEEKAEDTLYIVTDDEGSQPEDFMFKSIYDTEGKNQDIFKYVDTAISNIPISDASQAIIDQNTGAEIRFWHGTTAEYESIENKEENVLYILNDEVGGEIAASDIGYDNSISELEAVSVQQAIDEIIEYVNIRVPAWTDADEGKFLRIVNGVPTWTLIENAENISF